MFITNLKLVSSLIVFLSTLFSISIPIYFFSAIDKRRSDLKFVSFSALVNGISCFGAGVFLGASLLDLLPEVLHHTNVLLKSEFNFDNETSKRYPIGEFLIGLGFFLVLFVEQTVISFSSERQTRKTTVFFSCEDDQTTLSSNVQDENPLIATNRNDSSMNDDNDKDESFSVTKKNRLTLTRNFLLLLSLIIHSIFEGVALASTEEEKTFWELFFAILIHKSIIAFTVGLKLMKMKHRRFVLISSLIFSLATPIGIFSVLTTQKLFPSNRYATISHGILRAFACGTFFYITFFDVLPHELKIFTSTKRSRLFNVFFVFLGFIFIGLLSIVMK